MNTVEVVRLEGRRFVPERLEVRQVKRAAGVVGTAHEPERLATVRRELGFMPQQAASEPEKQQPWEAVPSLTFGKLLSRWFAGGLAEFIEMVVHGITGNTKKDRDKGEA